MKRRDDPTPELAGRAPAGRARETRTPPARARETRTPAALARRAIATLRDVLGGAHHTALVDVPNHPNVGDSAIWLGERAALRELGLGPPSFECDIDTFDPDALERQPEDGAILLHGGGNLGDLWPAHQGLRERVLRDFRDRRVIQLPQTIRFRETASLDRARQVFEGHPHLTLLVRDRDSEETALREFPSADVRLCPDFAFCLGSAHRPGRLRPPGRLPDTLWLLRSDHESARRPGAAARVEGPPPTGALDWLEEPSDLLGTAVRALTLRVARGAGPLAAERFLLSRLLVKLGARRVRRGLTLLGSARVVVTDRLHGHILCLLLGRPHILLPDRYGKNRSFHETWTVGHPLTRWCEDPASARETLSTWPGSGP